MYACARVCVYARVCVCVRATHTPTHTHTHTRALKTQELGRLTQSPCVHTWACLHVEIYVCIQVEGPDGNVMSIKVENLTKVTDEEDDILDTGGDSEPESPPSTPFS